MKKLKLVLNDFKEFAVRSRVAHIARYPSHIYRSTGQLQFGAYKMI
jgi:predicted phage gp36 major capsid-like protein